MAALSRYLERRQISRPAEITIDQAIGLPDLEDQDLWYEVDHPLDHESFDRWFRDVWKILKRAGVTKVIDIGIPRPRRDSPNADLWRDTSERLVEWLHCSMDDNIFAEVQNGCWGTQFADELMDVLIRRFWKRDANQDIRTVSGLMAIRRRKYNTATDFLKVFSQGVNSVVEQGDGISPYFAACIGLAQLTDTDDDSALQVAIKEMRKRSSAYEGNNPIQFDLADFNYVFWKASGETVEDDT